MKKTDRQSTFIAQRRTKKLGQSILPWAVGLVLIAMIGWFSAARLSNQDSSGSSKKAGLASASSAKNDSAQLKTTPNKDVSQVLSATTDTSSGLGATDARANTPQGAVKQGNQSVKTTPTKVATASTTTQPASSSTQASTNVQPAPAPAPVTTPTPVTPAPTAPRTLLGGSEEVRVLPADSEVQHTGTFSTSDGSSVYWSPMYRNIYWPGNELPDTVDPSGLAEALVYMDTPPNIATSTLDYTIAYNDASNFPLESGMWHEFGVIATDPATGMPISAVSVRFVFQ